MPSTYSAGSVSFLGSGNVSVISTSAGAIIFSGSASTHSHSTAPAAILASNATFTSGTVVFSGSTNVTVLTAGTGTQQTILFSAANAGGGAQTAISGVQASNATYTSGTVVFTGSNAATVKSAAGQQVVIDVPTQTAFVLSASNGLAFGTNASTVTGSYSQSSHAHSEYVFSNSNSFTFGTNASTVTASFSQSTHTHAAPAGTAYEFSPTPRGPIQGGYSVQALSTGQSLTVFPGIVPNMNLQTLRFQASLVTATFTNSSGSLSWGLAYYTRANATALSSVSSSSWSSTFSASATSQMSNVSGARAWSATMSWPLTPGEYYFAAYFQSSGAGTFSQNNYTISTTPEVGIAGAASAATEQYRFQFYGIRTNGTTAAFPSQIAASEMQYSGAAVSFPHFQLMGS